MRNLLLLCLLCLCWPLALHAADGEEEEQPKPVPQYYKLPQSLVANLTGGPRYIRCDIQLMYYDGDEHDNEHRLQLYSPALRHELLLMLIEQNGKTLTTPAGKERLRKTAVKSLRRIMEEQTGSPVIEDLYFTSYYVR
jgi:flagellar FliL protein